MKKRKGRNSAFVVLLAAAFISAVFFLRIVPSVVRIENRNNLFSSLTISDAIYYRQTLNNCAPYAVMGVINVLRGEEKDPEILAAETKWRIMKNLTFPQGLVDLAHSYHIKTREYSLKLYSAADKMQWLRNRIDAGSPVILLVKVKNIQHYFTVIGYDEQGFLLYDSLQEKEPLNQRKTIVDKPGFPGNRYYTSAELLDLWNGGGYKICFRNWALVCY